jgi:uncharacterized protein
VIRIYVDADGCPVKDEVFKVAKRYGLKVYLVSNSRMRLPQHELFEQVVVNNDKLDAADDWIIERLTETDILVTADLLFAARGLEKGARALDPKGRVFDRESIGNVLASRELSIFLRDMGNITGGPAPFRPRDRSAFLQRLDDLIQAALKAARQSVDK